MEAEFVAQMFVTIDRVKSMGKEQAKKIRGKKGISLEELKVIAQFLELPKSTSKGAIVDALFEKVDDLERFKHERKKTERIELLLDSVRLKSQYLRDCHEDDIGSEEYHFVATLLKNHSEELMRLTEEK